MPFSPCWSVRRDAFVGSPPVDRPDGPELGKAGHDRLVSDLPAGNARVGRFFAKARSGAHFGAAGQGQASRDGDA